MNIEGSWNECAKCEKSSSVCVVREHEDKKVYLCPTHAKDIGIKIYPDPVQCATCGKEIPHNTHRVYCSNECKNIGYTNVQKNRKGR